MLYTGTGLCVILVNVLVNSTKLPIFCDTIYVASVAENWLSWLVTFRIHCYTVLNVWCDAIYLLHK